jgi:glycosyltransferase involved in cell wall biosynthesis
VSHDRLPVTVVIPFYDGNDTIQRTIASIDAQTVPPTEILVVDDGSPDPVDPARLQADVDVRVLRHDGNRGIPAARNTAIRAARTDWIALLDQDDEWVPEKLEWQWRALERAGTSEDVVVFGRLLLPGDGDDPAWVFPGLRSVERMERGGRGALEELVHHGCVTPPVTLLFNRRILDRHGYLDESLRGGADDYELALRMAAAGARFVCDASSSGGRHSAVRHHTGRNYSAHAPRYLRDDLRIVEKLADRYPAMAELRDEALARVRYAFGRHYDRTGAHRRAAVSYRRATALDPLWPKPWLARARLAMPRSVQRLVERVWLRLERVWRDTVPG